MVIILLIEQTWESNLDDCGKCFVLLGQQARQSLLDTAHKALLPQWLAHFNILIEFLSKLLGSFQLLQNLSLIAISEFIRVLGECVSHAVDQLHLDHSPCELVVQVANIIL